MALAPSNILDFATTDKYATMAIFCHIRLEILLDSLADTMIKLIKSSLFFLFQFFSLSASYFLFRMRLNLHLK